MKKLILVGLLSSGLFASYLCDTALRDMQKYAASSNKAYELKLFNKEEVQRMFLKNELENVLLHCNLSEEQQKIVKENLDKTIQRISIIRQALK